MPSDLPLTLPSALVEQRPDVLQAEANIHAASAQIGVARANRLPNITLSANAGSNALAIGQVFGPGTGFWNLGAALLAPIFDGGTRLHQERGARAALPTERRAISRHRADRLPECRRHAGRARAGRQYAEGDGKRGHGRARAASTSSRLQYKDGYAAYLAVLNAQQAYQQARLSQVQAEADRFTDTAALFQALGRRLVAPPELMSAANGR